MNPSRRASSAAAVILAVAAAEGSAQTLRDDLHLSLTLASDYKLQGLSQTATEPAWQLAADYEHASGFFAGGFVANLEYAFEEGRERERQLQFDYYAGYSWRGGDWSTSVALSRYVYPDIDVRYDYTQVIASASYRDRYFVGASYTDNLLSLGPSALHVEVGVAVPWIWGLEFGANLGRFRSPDYFDTEFTHWDFGLSKVAGRFALDLRFNENTYDRYSLLGDSRGDRWVLSVAYAIAPRGR